MTEQNYALEQAKAQAASIIVMVTALNVDYDRLEELKDELSALEFDLSEAGNTEEEIGALKALAEWRTEYAEELRELEEAANGNTNSDMALEAIQNDPLDVQVRSDWYNPHLHDGSDTPSEFSILLCTGGPAVRIRGELDEYLNPTRAWIEYQDWGTPWTQLLNEIDQETLLTYCQQFYFGE